MPVDKAKYIQKECRKHGLTEHVLEGRGSYRCKRCRSEHVTNRRRKVKRQLVSDSGGKCYLCGYNKCPQALQFHHLDPKTKSFTISQMGNTWAYNRMLAEAQKCVLLCANCHAEVENGIAQLNLAG